MICDHRFEGSDFARFNLKREGESPVVGEAVIEDMRRAGAAVAVAGVVAERA